MLLPDFGSRARPLHYDWIYDAIQASRYEMHIIWTTIGDLTGIYKIYPGGRVIRFRPIEEPREP